MSVPMQYDGYIFKNEFVAMAYVDWKRHNEKSENPEPAWAIVRSLEGKHRIVRDLHSSLASKIKQGETIVAGFRGKKFAKNAIQLLD